MVVSILESQDQLTSTKIVNRLLEEYRKIAGKDGEMKMALLTKQKGWKKGKSGHKATNKSTKKCSACSKSGHIEEECWTKHPELRPKKGNPGESSKKSTRVAMSASFKKATSTDDKLANPQHWFLDSCASQHFSPHKDLFETFKEFAEPCEIETAEGITHGTGTGSIVITIIGENRLYEVELQNVIYAPKMEANLLSAVTLYDLGYEISMKPGKGVNIIKDDVIIGKTVRHGKVFRVQTLSNSAYSAVKAKSAKPEPEPESLDIWHRRLAHLGKDNVLKLQDLATGIAVDTNYELGVCEPCQEGKQTRQSSHEPAKRAKEPGELVHSDLCGPITPPSVGGHKYAGTFTDDATRTTVVVSLKTKTAAELLERFKEYKEEEIVVQSLPKQG